MSVHIHTLSNGNTIASISAHGFRFSDGTVSAAQLPEVVEKFTLTRATEVVRVVKGMRLCRTFFKVTPEQLDELRYLHAIVDLVVVPFPFLTALREAGVRDMFPRVVAFNATPETQRAANPSDKVVDIDNWSY
jgi:hypothetical protein